MSPYFIPTFKHPCNSKLVSYNFLLWCTSSKRHSALNTFLLFLAYCRPCVTLWHGSILSSNHLRNWDILLGDLEEFADFLVRLNESPDLVITHKQGCYKYKYKMISHIIKIKKNSFVVWGKTFCTSKHHTQQKLMVFWAAMTSTLLCTKEVLAS